MILSIDWETIKIKASNKIWIKYYIDYSTHEDLSHYLILIGNSTNQYYVKISALDLTDFNDNHKSTAIKVLNFNSGLEKII